MSAQKNDGHGGAEGQAKPRGEQRAASLTDAVVAALAQVEASSSTPPPAAPAETPPADGHARPEERLDEKTKVMGGLGERSEERPPREVDPHGSTTIEQGAFDPVAAMAEAEPTEPNQPSSTAEPPTVKVAIHEEATLRTAAEPRGDRRPEDVPDGVFVRYYGRTDVGLVREHNEDNFLVADLTKRHRGIEKDVIAATLGTNGCVFAVCDGMGGAAAGEVASQMAVDTVHEILQAGGPPRSRDVFARRLVRAIEEAGSRIFSAAKMDRTRRGMGTTSTVAALVDNTLFVGQVGDSRAYVMRGDQFALITKDQSLVNQLIEAGQLTEEEAEAFEHSNIILQALGTTEEVTVDLTFLELRRGDKLLMCSDGLSGLVHADMMREVLRSSRDLPEAAQQLIAMANAGGGHDNITVIVAEFDGKELKDPSPDARVAYQQYPLPPDDSIEDADVSSSYREPAIKSSSVSKPGADVKGGDSVSSRPALSDAEAALPVSSSRWWLLGVLLLVFVIGIAALVLLMDDGTRRSDVGASDRGPESAPVAVAAPHGRIRVSTDVEGGELYINGARSPEALEDGARTVTLSPGAYRLEVRRGGMTVTGATVTLAADEEQTLRLDMPVSAADALMVAEGEGPEGDDEDDEHAGRRDGVGEAAGPVTAQPGATQGLGVTGGQGVTGQGATGQGVSGQGATGQGATGQGATGQGTGVSGSASGGSSASGIVGGGTSTQGTQIISGVPRQPQTTTTQGAGASGTSGGSGASGAHAPQRGASGSTSPTAPPVRIEQPREGATL